MYYLKKKFEIAAAHNLILNYESPCQKVHGHNYWITVYCKSETLNENGMIVDFKQIKELIEKPLDHAYLNDIFYFNPTAENMAKWIVETVPHCYRADVEETANNVATYEVQ